MVMLTKLTCDPIPTPMVTIPIASGLKPSVIAIGKMSVNTEPTYAPAGTPMANPTKTVAGTNRNVGADAAKLAITPNVPVLAMTLMNPKKIPTWNNLVRI